MNIQTKLLNHYIIVFSKHAIFWVCLFCELLVLSLWVDAEVIYGLHSQTNNININNEFASFYTKINNTNNNNNRPQAQMQQWVNNKKSPYPLQISLDNILNYQWHEFVFNNKIFKYRINWKDHLITVSVSISLKEYQSYLSKNESLQNKNKITYDMLRQTAWKVGLEAFSEILKNLYLFYYPNKKDNAISLSIEGSKHVFSTFSEYLSSEFAVTIHLSTKLYYILGDPQQQYTAKNISFNSESKSNKHSNIDLQNAKKDKKDVNVTNNKKGLLFVIFCETHPLSDFSIKQDDKVVYDKSYVSEDVYKNKLMGKWYSQINITNKKNIANLINDNHLVYVNCQKETNSKKHKSHNYQLLDVYFTISNNDSQSDRKTDNSVWYSLSQDQKLDFFKKSMVSFILLSQLPAS